MSRKIRMDKGRRNSSRTWTQHCGKTFTSMSFVFSNYTLLNQPSTSCTHLEERWSYALDEPVNYIRDCLLLAVSKLGNIAQGKKHKWHIIRVYNANMLPELEDLKLGRAVVIPIVKEAQYVYAHKLNDQHSAKERNQITGNAEATASSSSPFKSLTGHSCIRVRFDSGRTFQMSS